MRNTPNVWSVAGIPGSGKTAFGEALVKNGGFDVVDFDAHFGHIDGMTFSKDEMSELIVGNTIRGINRDAFVRSFKAELHTLIQWLRAHPAPIMKRYIPFFESALRITAPSASFLGYLVSQGLFAIMLNLFAQRRSLESAETKAKNSDRTVLWTNPGLNFFESRREVKMYWKTHGIPPQLAIVRSRVDRVFNSALDRQRLDTTGVDRSRYNLDNILQHEPYQPHEDWPRVIAVDNLTTPEDLANRFRDRLSSQVGDVVTKDIQFLLRS